MILIHDLFSGSYKTLCKYQKAKFEGTVYTDKPGILIAVRELILPMFQEPELLQNYLKPDKDRNKQSNRKPTTVKNPRKQSRAMRKCFGNNEEEGYVYLPGGF